MVEFIVCFGSDDEKKENKRKKGIQNGYQRGKERREGKKKGKHNKETEQSQTQTMTITMTNQSLYNPNNNNNNNIIFSSSSCIKPSPELYEEELDSGNLEYKLKLTDITEQKLEKRITQMNCRLREGNGECRYYIGVEDSGNPIGITEDEMRISIETLQKMTSNIGATIVKIEYLKGKEGFIAEFTITKPQTEKELMEVKIGLFGEEESGKSTLIGCLITDRKDNGKGVTRANVFRHRHEIKCGKTSSFTHQIIGFDKNGKKTNINFGSLAPWPSIVEKSVKIVNCIDMGGSEKSLQNSLKTFSSNYLDYIFLVISARNGITNNTSVFLKLALSLNIPIAVIFTKIDQVNQDDFETLLMGFNTILKAEKKGKNPLVVRNTEDIVTFANNMTEGIMPIFLVSNVTGIGLDYVNNFLSILPAKENLMAMPSNMHKKDNGSSNSGNSVNDDLKFDFLEIIHKKDTFDIGHVIIEGIVTNGILYKGEKYRLGPFNDGGYKRAKIIMLHCKKMAVNYAIRGQFCSVEIEFDLKKLKDSNTNTITSTTSTIVTTTEPSTSVMLKDIIAHIRTGMVLIGSKRKETATRQFLVELWSMSDQTYSIKYSYQPLVHLSHITQCVKIYNETRTNKDTDTLTISPNETICLLFEFLYTPEYITENTFLIILDHHIKIYGHVKAIVS